MIYAIETSSAIVIHTIRSTDEMHDMKIRNIFTVSPCGTFIFTKCSQEEQINCFRISDGDCVGQIRVPHSLITKKYAVTSISYHPTKNLIAYSIFGSNIHSCLFQLCSDLEPFKQQNDETYLKTENDRRLEYDSFKFHDLQAIQSQDLNDIKSVAIESILSRIDDLFFLAIRSPQHANAKEQLMNMQLILEKFSQESMQQNKDDTIQNMIQNAQGRKENSLSNVTHSISSGSNESKNSKLKSDLIDELRAKAWQMESKNEISAKSIDSESSSSHHTFQIDRISNEKELSNATYSIQSDSDGNQQTKDVTEQI